MLNRESDISDSAVGKAAAEVYKGKKPAVLARKKAIVWEVPHGLDATQVLLGHMVHFVSLMLENYPL